MLRIDQHAAGYAVQTAFIGAGAVVGSIFPWALEQLGVSNLAAGGGIPDTVRYAFWFGGGALFLSVVWTVVTTREYAPDAMAAFDDPADPAHAAPLLATRSYVSSLVWLAAGAIVIWAVGQFGLEKEVYLLGALLLGYGIASAAAIGLARERAAAVIIDAVAHVALLDIFSAEVIPRRPGFVGDGRRVGVLAPDGRDAGEEEADDQRPRHDAPQPPLAFLVDAAAGGDAEPLRRIFDHLQSVFSGDGIDRVHVGGLAVEMHDEDGFSQTDP